MAHKSTPAGLIATALLIGLAAAGQAQQMPGSAQPGSPAGAGRRAAPPAAGASQLTVVPEDFADLKLAPGFLVSLDVLDDPDFQGGYRVDQQGDLELPIIGNMHVAGETASEARVQIQAKLLADQILKSPQVNLTVTEYTAPEVTIMGEVGAPGKYPLLAAHNLNDVLALAGGLTPAAGNEIQVTRKDTNADPVVVHYSRAMNSKAAADVIVHPGDTVQVKRAGIVYVLGAVNKPGGYVMQEDGTLTVLEAVSLASGTQLAAQTGTVYLLRRNADGTGVTISLPLDKMSHGKSADVRLHATDVVYVPMNKVKSVLINSQAILASITSSTIYATAIY